MFHKFYCSIWRITAIHNDDMRILVYVSVSFTVLLIYCYSSFLVLRPLLSTLSSTLRLQTEWSFGRLTRERTSELNDHDLPGSTDRPTWPMCVRRLALAILFHSFVLTFVCRDAMPVHCHFTAQLYFTSHYHWVNFLIKWIHLYDRLHNTCGRQSYSHKRSCSSSQISITDSTVLTTLLYIFLRLLR